MIDIAETRASRAGRRRPAKPTVVLAAIVSSLTLLPAAYLLVRAADAGASEIFAIVTEGRTAGLLVRTAALALAVTAASIAIGVPIAWLTVRTDLPMRRLWTVLTVLPLVIPSYVGGFAIIAAIGPRGFVQRWLEPLGVDRLPDVYGFFGAWLALTLVSYPYVLLTTRAALRRLDPALEEASAGLGVSRRGTLRRVVLPQLRPSIASGGLLVGLYALHDFGAVSLLRFESFTYGIYLSYRGSFDRSKAAVLSLVLVLLALGVVGLEARARGRAAYFRAQGVARRPPVVALGRWRWPAFGGCALLCALSLGLPVGAIVFWLVRSARDVEPLSDLYAPAVRSLGVATTAAVAAVLCAWPVAVLGVRWPSRFARTVERATFTGYALPGIVVALALVFFGIRAAPALYQTVPMLVFAYVVLFLPQAGGALRTSLLQVNPNLEEAARSLGATRARSLSRVSLPLVRSGLFAGGALVALTVMKELPATLLLAPAGFQTLATEVWGSTSASFFDRAAPPALALILLASVPLAVLVLRDRDARP